MLLASFPEPILNPTEVSKYSLQLNYLEQSLGPVGIQHFDEMNVLAVASVHGQPQGEILEAIHNHIISHPNPLVLDSKFYRRLCYILTHEEVQLERPVVPPCVLLTINIGMARRVL